jgi:hypothetical protein
MARIFLADDYESVRMAVRSSSDSELLSGLGGVQVVSSLSDLKGPNASGVEGTPGPVLGVNTSCRVLESHAVACWSIGQIK